VSNKFRHIFILPDLVVEKGDFIWLYTKPGVYGTHTNTSGATTHKLYWGVLSHIWNNDGDKAYLIMTIGRIFPMKSIRERLKC
jgi:hypothetical protein